MLQKILDYNFKEIDVFRYLCITMGIMTFVLLSVLKTDFLYIDDLRIAATPNNSGLGRPLYDYIFSFLHGKVLINASPASQLICLFSLSLSSYIILKSLQIKINIYCGVISAVIIGRYGMVEVLSYKLDSMMHIFPILFSALAFYIMVNDKIQNIIYKIIMSTILCSMAISLYQHGIIIYVILMLFCTIKNITSGKKINYEIAIPVILCFVLYWLYLKNINLGNLALATMQYLEVINLQKRANTIINSYLLNNHEQAILLMSTICIMLIKDLVQIYLAKDYSYKCIKFITIILFYPAILFAQYLFTFFILHDGPSLVPRGSYLHGVVLFINLCSLGEYIKKNHIKLLFIISIYILVLKIALLVNFYGNMLTSQDRHVSYTLNRVIPFINLAHHDLKLDYFVVENSIGFAPIITQYLPHHQWLRTLVPVHINSWFGWSYRQMQHYGVKPTQLIDKNSIKRRNQECLGKDRSIYVEFDDFRIEYNGCLLFLIFK